VKETPERDRGLLGLVERIMRRPGDPEPIKTETDADADTRDGLDPVVAEDAAPASLEPQLSVESTRTLGRSEIADVILRALRGIDGCPPDGFEVVVYGTRPWNAMLRITPAAGAVPDARAWRQRVQDMVQLLRHQYELSE
jgi:hypothetical protein